MWSLIGAALSWLLSLITGRKEAAGVAQGRTEQRAADAEANLDLIRKANIAAKQAEQEEGVQDPNDRAAR